MTICEIANGAIPFAEMPNTYMLLEKMRGTPPKLYDSTTYDSENAGVNNDLVFSGQKPADSGVGASVGSCSNLPKNKNYSSRTFSELYHDFVKLCCHGDADERPSSIELVSTIQLFLFRQNGKTNFNSHQKYSFSELILDYLAMPCCTYRNAVKCEKKTSSLTPKKYFVKSTI